MDAPSPKPAAGTGPASRRSPRPLSIVAWVFGAAAVVLLALALVIAIFLPYGEWDAMSYGTWSRLIAEHFPHIHPYGGPSEYQRPVFFFLQATLWRVFGFHVALGRLLSLSYSLLLLGSVGYIASQVAPRFRRFSAALAVVVVLIVADFDRYIAAGMTDVPVAAMVALTAAVLFMRRLGRAQLPLLGLVSAVTVLTKPSAIPALLGLGAAVLIGPRLGLRRRSYTALAVCLGIGAALLYDLEEAHYLHMGLRAFVTYGTGGFYAALSDRVRKQVLLDAGWLGADLRVFLWFGFVYAIVRLVRVRHRVAVLIAVPVAAGWSWLGPHLSGAHGLRVGILGTGTTTEQVAVLVLAASLLFAFDSPSDVVPDRLRLARLLVWATPTLVFWGVDGVYNNTRELAPAWPALALLITWTLLPAFAGALQRREVLVAIPATALLVLVLLASYNIGGLGRTGWSQLRAGGLSGLTNAAFTRNVALGGDFAAELNALMPQVRPHDRILTYDARLRFFYADQIDSEAPQSCSQLAGHRIFVLLEDDEIREQFGKPAESAFWEACPHVTLTKIDEHPGAFAVFVVGTPSSSTGGCGSAPPADQGLAVEFGRFKTAAEADALQKHLAGVGFVQAKVEQLGCASYRVVETGVPSQAVGQSIVAEAKSAGIKASLVSH